MLDYPSVLTHAVTLTLMYWPHAWPTSPITSPMTSVARIVSMPQAIFPDHNNECVCIDVYDRVN
jgi:hypothetical protein